ncbi:glycosyltransferase family 2 protein [Formosa sp. S-31]|uniref:glycosyltransferase family 2 protein n=1 Tax=Formosa sp. S-31 TaxID=2790949 RepID=UPI003EBF35D4
MLSILIPTYNYNIFHLVKSVHEQCLNAKINFEIIVVDDASTNTESVKFNTEVKQLSYTRHILLKKNSGRSFARNYLASLSQFENLLFLDADTLPIHSNFIEKYLKIIDLGYEVIYGGISYQIKKPQHFQILRWIYGIDRESVLASERQRSPYISFLTLNFLIKKTIIKQIPFNENIPNLRHEDTLFSFNLKENKIKISHIDNPVLHLGLEDSRTFLKKSEESVWSLHHLISNDLIPISYTKLGRAAFKLKTTKLDWVVLSLYGCSKKIIRQNLLSKKPSLFLMDFYRLGYYLYTSKNKI